MLVVLGLLPIFIVIVVVWPIVAIARQQQEQPEYPFTACVAAWYAQIMAMVGIVVFTIGIGYLFKSLIGFLNLNFSYGPTPFPILHSQEPATVTALEQQRQVDLLVRLPSFIVSGPVIYFVHAYLSRTVSSTACTSPLLGHAWQPACADHLPRHGEHAFEPPCPQFRSQLRADLPARQPATRAIWGDTWLRARLHRSLRRSRIDLAIASGRVLVVTT